MLLSVTRQSIIINENSQVVDVMGNQVWMRHSQVWMRCIQSSVDETQPSVDEMHSVKYGWDAANCGWDAAKCGWGAAKYGWDITWCGWDIAAPAVKYKVYTVLGSIPTSFSTVGSTGRQMEQRCIKYLKISQSWLQNTHQLSNLWQFHVYFVRATCCRAHLLL